jgi:hypothetical protein
MKLKIQFKLNDGDMEKTYSRTFSNINQTATNSELVEFARAYMSLTDLTDFQVYKITTEEVNI